MTAKKTDKKLWVAVLAICILLLLWLYASHSYRPDDAGVTSTASAALVDPASGHLLVDFDNDATPEEIDRLARRYGLSLRLNSEHSRRERLYRTLRLRTRARELLARLRAEPLVERAEVDEIYSLPPFAPQVAELPADEKREKTFPNDPKYKYQWHLDQINMPDAWPRATGQGVIVAVIDTGVAYRDRGKTKRVPDLANTEFVKGYDFVNDNDQGVDDHGHGTHVAGTIAQSTNNGIGVAGTAYRARIMPLKVLNSRGFGSLGDIADAIRFAADNGAKVINMSLGASRSSPIMKSAVKYAYDKGVVVVCAAGNNGQGRVSYPAAYPEALAVAATQFDRSTTFYSNWGKQIDVAAPGGNTRVDQNGDGMPDGVLQNTIIPGRTEQNDYLLFMGTSMAAPHVAGAAALVIQRGVTRPEAVEALLESTARHPQNKPRDDHYGAGIIDVGQALKKSTTDWSAYQLGLSALLGVLLLTRLRGRGLLGIRPGPGMLAGVVLGSSGLFFLSGLGLTQALPAPLATLLTSGVPGWDAAALGTAGQGNPLFHSLLIPLGAALLLYGVPRMRGLVFGLAVGVAGHLLFQVPVNAADIQWIPNVLALDQIWLAVNAAACLGIAHLVARE